MSLFPSFDIGVAALVAQSEAMGAISNNVANQRTPGYRGAETMFSTLLGGIEARPHQSGGVQATTRRLVDLQGAVEQTGNALDIALSGKGMYVYSTTEDGSGEISYSRNANLFATHFEDDGSGPGFLTSFEDLYLMAWPYDTAGNVAGTTLAEMVAIPATLEAGFPGRATTLASLSAILPAAGGTTVSTDVHYFDAAGAQQTVTLVFTDTGVNTWDLQPTDSLGAPIGAVHALTFDGQGDLSSATTLDIGGLFTLDIAALTQRGDFFFRGLYDQNGLAAGDFVQYDIGQDGTLYGNYTSGAVEPLYKLPLALFGSPNRLTEVADNRWIESDGSGTPEFVEAQEIARTLAGSRELANVDLADAFTQMIVTQRAYASAAQVVQTADEMSQTLRDLKR
jgi:flagellar hook protein FlgE